MQQEKNKGLSIAILGTRGIPASYGGFETFAEELSSRLVNRGHRLTVYARKRFFEKGKEAFEYRGVLVRFAPTVMHKYLETPLHALFSFLDLAFHRVDVVLLCNAANSPFAWIVRLLGIPLLINVDGVERKRSKWNSLGKAWYRLGEICSVLFATRVVGDAKVIESYYKETYGVSSEVIGYGATVVRREAGETLTRFGLEAGKFLLYVSRLEPENNALGVIEAYSRIKSPFPLVVVGDAPYAAAYKEKLKAAAGPEVIFTGYQFGKDYQELRSNCYTYIQATEVGGTHPALVEAMAYGNCVIANTTPEHEEVLGDAGLYYRFNDFSHLGEIIEWVLSNPEEVNSFGQKARGRAEELYTWDRVTEQYEKLCLEVVGRG